MAEVKTSSVDLKHHMDVIYNVNYSFNDRYGLSFISPQQFMRIGKSLSFLRRVKQISGDCYYSLNRVFDHQHNNYYRIKQLISNEPRINAQKFIGKRNIREFIFKRDNYSCLRCGATEKLTLDHIVPIHRGGKNKLMNLQTLCKSCNSIKSTTIKDYRR